jgi:hypothetical protein
MSTLIIKRPKDREKYYDESNFKIYINGKLVGKLGQNETKEITVEDNFIEIQAKSSFGGSAKVEIELEERFELEIIRIKQFKIPMLIFFLFPIIFTAFYQFESYWVRILSIIPIILIFGWMFYWYRKNKYNAIRITKI